MAVMAEKQKRPRVYFDADEELKVAITLEKIKRGADTESALIVSILRESLKDSIADAKKFIKQRKKEGD